MTKNYVTEKHHRQGVCPVCGSTEIDYGAFEFDDDGGVYPAECLDCFATFNEAYTFVFDSHYDIKPLEKGGLNND